MQGKKRETLGKGFTLRLSEKEQQQLETMTVEWIAKNKKLISCQDFIRLQLFKRQP